MTLAQSLLGWPQSVASQVFSALLIPAGDLHPAQAQLRVPAAMAPLSAVQLSQALADEHTHRWSEEFDGRQLTHRLALLPSVLITQVAWNLGLLMHGATLRQVIASSALAELAAQGLDESDWALVFKAGSPGGRSQSDALREVPLAEWPAALLQHGEQSLAALAATLAPSLGQRLQWKLPPAAAKALPVPAASLLEAAYGHAVQTWSSDWDKCLTSLPRAH
jgi:hypothetical protein